MVHPSYPEVHPMVHPSYPACTAGVPLSYPACTTGCTLYTTRVIYTRVDTPTMLPGYTMVYMPPPYYASRVHHAVHPSDLLYPS